MLYDGDLFEYEGMNFKLGIFRDEDMRTPWEEHDGFGVVSDWTRRDKAPGERILCEDRGSKRYYDIQETMKLAKRDGWGVHGETFRTKGQRAAAAVKKDFDYLRQWCNDDWFYVVISVTLCDDDGDEVADTTQYLGGVEYGLREHEEHVMEMAHELAREIIYKMQRMAA